MDDAKLEELCQQRNLKYRQAVCDDLQLKRDEIERNANLVSSDVPRPYGIPREMEGASFDIWELILRYVSEPKDIRNLWEVSSMFRELLEEKYIQTRLPEIAKLIHDKRPSYLKEDGTEENRTADVDVHENDDHDHGFQTFAIRKDFREEILWYSRFRKMRLISSQCKRSVEELCFSDFFTREKGKAHTPILRFTTAEKLQRITEFLHKDPSSMESFFPLHIMIDEGTAIYGRPFAPNYVRPDAQVLQRFHEAFITFLEVIGHRIRFFSYDTYQPKSSLIYNSLRTFVGLMPNLEYIMLADGKLAGYEYENSAEEELIRIQPFPTCRMLRCYQEKLHCPSLPNPFMERVLEASPMLSDLRLRNAKYVREYSPEVLNSLVNMTSLEIGPKDLAARLSHCHLPWKLSKISIGELRFLEEKFEFSSSDLFPFLNQFRDTLECLEIMAPVIDTGGYLELQNLKAFKWLHPDAFPVINFLLNAGMLSNLHVITEHYFMWKSSLRERYMAIFGESFIGSRDVWEVFPHLKWTRVDYPRWSENRGIKKTRPV